MKFGLLSEMQHPIKMYEDIGVDQIMLIMQTETIPHDRVMESIELYGKEVIPAFADANVA